MSDESRASTQASSEDGLNQPKMAINIADGTIIVERTNAEEREVLARIAEILDVITERLDLSKPSQTVDYVITDRKAVDTVSAAHHFSRSTKHHHVNWMHFINFVFVGFIGLSLITPPVLANFFGMGIFVSKVNHPEIPLKRGDVMITKLTPVSALKRDDLIIVRNDLSWNSDVHAVYAISNSIDGGLTTVTEQTGGSTAQGDQSTVNSSTKVRRVTNVIPRISNLAIAVTSSYVKIFVVVFVFFLNVITYIVRRRRRHLSWG